MSAAKAAATGVISKEKDFMHGIERQNAVTGMLADFLAADGIVEKAVRAALESSGDEELANFEGFLEEQRTKVKSLTEGHIGTQRHAKAFISAMKSIKSDIENGTHSTGTANGADRNGEDDVKPAPPPNFEEILQNQIEAAKQQASVTYIDMQDEDMMKSVREKLRERVTGGDDDDIELEISNEENEASFKCPITQMIFKRPMKNKVCHHVYSYEGITHYLRSKRRCPVAGCRNENVTMQQLHECEETKLRVRRFESRAAREREQRMTQDNDDYLDVDVDNMEGEGTTFIE